MTRDPIPSDPLARFRELHAEIELRRKWSQPAASLRFAAAALMTCQGPAYQVADRLFATADGLSRHSRWFSPLQSSARFMVAAMLLRHDGDPRRFCEDVERAGAQLRELGLRSGSTFEVLAVLILRGAGESGLSARSLQRFADTYAAMKHHHWWLTGPDDYPACARLSLRDASVHDIARRGERFYAGLRELGLPPGDPLQLTSHILFLNPADDREVLRRFKALHAAFREAGVSMWQSDFDELACLTMLDEDTGSIVGRVLEHRAVMKELRPRMDVTETFSLASSTAFLAGLSAQASSPRPGLRDVLDVGNVLQVAQSAMVASAAAASASAASTAAVT